MVSAQIAITADGVRVIINPDVQPPVAILVEHGPCPALVIRTNQSCARQSILRSAGNLALSKRHCINLPYFAMNASSSSHVAGLCASLPIESMIAMMRSPETLSNPSSSKTRPCRLAFFAKFGY